MAGFYTDISGGRPMSGSITTPGGKKAQTSGTRFEDPRTRIAQMQLEASGHGTGPAAPAPGTAPAADNGWAASLANAQRIEEARLAQRPGMPPSMNALTQTPGYARGNASGDASVTQGAYDRQQEIQLAHDLRMQEMNSKKDMFTTLLGQFGGGNSPRVTRTPENQAGEQAARDAAFARAKEKAGQTARASMAALDNIVAERGMMGSTVHAGKAGAIVGGAAGEIGEFLRDQAITESDRAAEVSDMDFMAQVSQRGQEMSRRQAMMGLLGNMLY